MKKSNQEMKSENKKKEKEKLKLEKCEEKLYFRTKEDRLREMGIKERN